jgi:small subunit ribosomal protein S1
VGRLRDEPQEGRQGSGAIKSITDFGIFIGLPGGIDGLVHLSDLSWSRPAKKPSATSRRVTKLKPVVLGIDVEKERISLGIKQMEGDPYTNFIATHEKNSIVRAPSRRLMPAVPC